MQSAFGPQHCLPSSCLPHNPPIALQKVFGAFEGVAKTCDAAAAIADSVAESAAAAAAPAAPAAAA
jgi:hypothetical protein